MVKYFGLVLMSRPKTFMCWLTILQCTWRGDTRTRFCFGNLICRRVLVLTLIKHESDTMSANGHAKMQFRVTDSQSVMARLKTQCYRQEIRWPLWAWAQACLIYDVVTIRSSCESGEVICNKDHDRNAFHYVVFQHQLVQLYRKYKSDVIQILLVCM